VFFSLQHWKTEANEKEIRMLIEKESRMLIERG